GGGGGSRPSRGGPVARDGPARSREEAERLRSARCPALLAGGPRREDGRSIRAGGGRLSARRGGRGRRRVPTGRLPRPRHFAPHSLRVTPAPGERPSA